MDIMTLLMIFIVVLFLFGLLFIFIALDRSYKNEVMIARQTGRGDNDVIWIRDRFRVVNRDGLWIIEFKKLREKTRSVDGRFWMRFIKGSSQNKLLKLTKEEWDAAGIASHIKRGLFMYETTEGELYPITIKRDGKSVSFEILNQDNKMFIINETQSINDLTRNKNKDMMILWGIIIGIAILGVVFMVFMYFSNKTYQAQLNDMASICGTITQQIINSPATNATRNSFLQTATKTLGG